MPTYLADDTTEIGRLMRARAAGEDVDAPFVPVKYRYGEKPKDPATEIPAVEDLAAIRQGISALKSSTYNTPPPLPAGTPAPVATLPVATDFVAIKSELRQRLVRLPMDDFNRPTTPQPVINSFGPVVQGNGIQPPCIISVSVEQAPERIQWETERQRDLIERNSSGQFLIR